MNKEEYHKKILEIEKEFKIKINSLQKEYALSNNPYQVNDIIQDHSKIIKIEKINFSMNFDNPECTYYGARLKKNLTTFKNEEKGHVWQSNILKQV